MLKLIKSNDGFSLLEIIFAVALLAIFITAASSGLTYGVRASKDAGRKQQATYLAEEGLAAAQNIRDAAYTNLSNGTYGVTTAGNQWNLSGASDTTGIFTRSVAITAPDATKKQITSTVTWNDTKNMSRSISLVSYLSDWLSTILSDWSTAAIAGSIDLTGNQNLLKIASSGNYAYGVRSINGGINFYIFDISITTAPVTVGSMTLNGTPSNVAVSGNYAYVTSSDDSQDLQIINITNPAAPTLAASLDIAGKLDATGIAISGSYAYVTKLQGADKELSIINITNPLVPVLTGSLDLAGDANEVAVVGNYAYIASAINNQELQIINVIVPALPILLGGYDVPVSSIDSTTVAASGTTVYLGVGNNLWVINDTVAAAPTLYGGSALSGTVNDVAIGTTSANIFVATSYATSEFRVVDATNPAIPSVLASVNLVSNANGVAYNSSLDIVALADSGNVDELTIINHP